MISVVIPAHDEAGVIGPCLRRILDGADPDELEVVVVCNACSDDTAAVARSIGPPVQVVETAVAGKTNALNLGDLEARRFPRFYVDADVRIGIEDLRAVAAAMEDGSVLAAAPRLEVDTSASNVLVRSYYKVWLRLAWAEQALIGSGVYAVSEAGRRRFGPFPSRGWGPPGQRIEPPAEDLWVRAHFATAERRSVPEASFTVPASRTLREVIRRKARIRTANRLLAPEIVGLPGAMAPRPQGFLEVVRRDPRLLPAALVYASAGLLASVEARRMARMGNVRWGRDRRHVVDESS